MDAVFSHDVKMRLKKKAEQRLQKKESKSSSQILIQNSLFVLRHEIYSGETVSEIRQTRSLTLEYSKQRDVAENRIT